MFGLTGIWRFIVPVLAALAFIALIAGSIKSCKQIDADQDNQLVNSGELKEREAGHSEVLNHVKESRDAVNNPTVNDSRNVCTKYDRNCPNG